MDELLQLEASIKRSLELEEEAWRKDLTVERLEEEMKDNDLDIVFRERAAIGRYLLTKGVDFLIVKTVVSGHHWGAIHPWNDEDGKFVPEKMLQDSRFK